MLNNLKSKLGQFCLQSGVKINQLLTGKNYFQEVSEVILSLQNNVVSLNVEYKEQIEYNKQQYIKRLGELISELKQYKQIKAGFAQLPETCINFWDGGPIFYDSFANEKDWVDEADPMGEIIHVERFSN